MNKTNPTDEQLQQHNELVQRAIEFMASHPEFSYCGALFPDENFQYTCFYFGKPSVILPEGEYINHNKTIYYKDGTFHFLERQ